MQEPTLGKLISGKRKQLKLTQKELSIKAGVGLRFVRELETGKPTLQINKVNQVLKLFGFELGAVEIRHKETDNEEC